MTGVALRVRDSLQPDDAPIGILAGDAGEAAAINLYGRGHALPEVISGSNSHWLRGYGQPATENRYRGGFSPRTGLETVFDSCHFAGRFAVPYGIENSAIGDHTDIFVYRGPRAPWQVFWKRFHWFG